MEIKKKKNFKLILFGVIILIMFIIVAIVVYNSKVKINNETISAKETTSNIGITSESTANSWDTSKLSEIIVDTSMTDNETGEKITMYVPIPNGYTASKATSEDTVVEGLVIYEGTDVVNDSNVIDAKTTRNQYVWIPVDPDDVYWTDSDGSIYGIYYTFSSTNAVATKGKREPYISDSYSYYYQDYYFDTYVSNFESELELESDMENDFNEMIDSIKKYGGFFIARYEIGDNELESRSSSSGITSEAVSMQGKYPYNYVNWYQAYDLSKTLSKTNENVTTTLIWGTLWDNTLRYLVESGNKTYSEIVNSTSWGNYYDATFTYTNMLGDTVTKSESSSVTIPTGSTEYTKACNIYDMAGNVYEWTSENHNNARYKSVRGEASNKTNCGASSSSNNNVDNVRWSGSTQGCGFRAILYIS